MSLNEYLLARMNEIAKLPTVPELAERIRERASYDACYPAVAEALDDPLLLTADAGLATVARDVLGDGAVRHVG